MSFRFLHTADIHIDSPLVGLSAYGGAPAERLRSATREAFVKIIDLALHEDVAFVVIAGDLYDGGWKDYNTGLFFAKQMGRLRDVGVPVYLLDGNHDAESEMTKSLRLPDNVHKFSSRKAETFRIDDLQVALHGRSFRARAEEQNLVSSYPEPVREWLNIGVLHTSLEGASEHSTYAPCSEAELVAKGYQYWALGHVHEHRVVSDAPPIVYPGNPQGRHTRETGARGVVLVEVTDGAVRHERHWTDVLRWHRLEADVSRAEDLDEAMGIVQQGLLDLLDEGSGLPWAVRVELTGRTAAHGELMARETQLRQEVLARALTLGGDSIWIEKVKLRTEPVLDQEQRRLRSDALAELEELFANASGDDTLLANLRKDMGDFSGRVEAEVRNADELAAPAAGRVDGLIEEAALRLLARLEGAEG